MFGANKRLRDLGKEENNYNPIDYNCSKNYTNYNNMNVNNGMTIKPKTKGSAIVTVFIVIWLIVFFGSFISFFNEFIDVFYYEDEYYYNDDYLDDTYPNTEEKRPVFEEEWANRYYEYFANNSDKFDNYLGAFVDLNFDNTPELLLYSHSDTTDDYIVYLSSSNSVTLITFDSSIFGMQLLKSRKDDSYLWALTDRHKNENNQYTGSVSFYRMDNTLYRKAASPDNYYVTTQLIYNDYRFVSYVSTFYRISEDESDFKRIINNYYTFDKTLNDLMIKNN